MLAKKNRLTKNKDFSLVFGRGKGFRQEFLDLVVLETAAAISRVGFVVSAGLSKKASLRNKVKRQLREIVRKKIGEIKKGVDAVIIARREILSKKFNEIEKTTDNLLSKAGILERQNKAQ